MKETRSERNCSRVEAICSTDEKIGCSNSFEFERRNRIKKFIIRGEYIPSSAHHIITPSIWIIFFNLLHQKNVILYTQ